MPPHYHAFAFFSGFALERKTNPSLNSFVSIARNSSFVPVVGQWYTIMLSAKGTSLMANLYLGPPPNPTGVMADMFNGAPPLVTFLVTDSNVGTGGTGIMVDGRATIDSYIVRGSCDASGVACTNMYDGSACHYGCSAGYYAVPLGTVCGRSGSYYTSAKCRAFSPVMSPDQSFSVLERSSGSTQIVPAVKATVAVESIFLSFAIANQGPSPYSDTFGISLCAGNLIVNNPANLDLTLDPKPLPLWVNVSAISDGDPATAVFSVFNVTIIPVPLPPYFNESISPLSFVIPEGTPGPMPPALIATDPQLLPLQYGLVFSTVTGAFSVDNATGVLSIPPPGLDYVTLAALVSVL